MRLGGNTFPMETGGSIQRKLDSAFANAKGGTLKAEESSVKTVAAEFGMSVSVRYHTRKASRWFRLLRKASVGGRRIWLVSKPKDQTPYAESHDPEEVRAEVAAKRQEHLIWGAPGERPRWVEVAQKWFGFRTRIGQDATKPAIWYSAPSRREPPLSGDPVAKFVPFLKAAEEQVVYGVVLEPGDARHPDTQGDWVRADEIEPAADDFMRRYRRQKAAIGRQHRTVAEVDILQSFIAPEDMRIDGKAVKAGSWVLKCYIGDDGIWEDVKAGRLTGFSIGGLGERVEAQEARDDNRRAETVRG